MSHRKTQDEKYQMMTEAPIPGLIGRLAVPTIISMMITSFYNMADTFFVGRISGISNSQDGQTYRLDVNLGTDFANLRDVSVIATPYKAEIDTLHRRAAAADAALEE